MSILLESVPPEPGQWAILFALAAVGLAGAWAIGVFRGASVYGRRMESHPRLAPLAVPFLIGVVTFFLSQAVYIGYVQTTRGTPGQALGTEQFILMDWLFLATAPFALALGAMAIANAVIPGAGLRNLGLHSRWIVPGFLWGVLGILIAAPIVFWFSAVSEWFYRKIDYVHPMEHDLLRVLPQADSYQRLLLLLGITVFAPVAEEILFRGHLQTMLRRLLGGRSEEPPVIPPLSVPALATEAPAMLNDEFAAPVPPAPIDNAQAPWTAWVAILITSMLFAVIHPIWSVPPIFLLSVALGFAYERTGNLWTAIFMHALFNGGSTVIFILAQSPR